MGLQWGRVPQLTGVLNMDELLANSATVSTLRGSHCGCTLCGAFQSEAKSVLCKLQL